MQIFQIKPNHKTVPLPLSPVCTLSPLQSLQLTVKTFWEVHWQQFPFNDQKWSCSDDKFAHAMWMWSHCGSHCCGWLTAICLLEQVRCHRGNQREAVLAQTVSGTPWMPDIWRHTHTSHHTKLWAKVTKLSSKRTHNCAWRFLKTKKRLKHKKAQHLTVAFCAWQWLTLLSTT